MFKQIKASHIYQDALGQIEEAILQGKLKPGDRLPPERELVDTMGVSRPTLREALRALEHKGLIEVRTGVKGGAYVKAVGIDQIVNDMDLLIRHKRISVRHLYEFREGVEGNAAGLATERAQEEDVDQLERILERAGKYVNRSANADAWKKFYQAESRLHQLMARLSGNPIYEWALSAVHTGISSYHHLLPHDSDHLESMYDDWVNILKTMRLKQVSRVQVLTTSHVIRANNYLQEQGRRSGEEPSKIMIEL